MDVSYNFKCLRVKLRQNSKMVVEDVLSRHIPKISAKDKSKKEICIFCASDEDITKEHVLPKWTFEKSTEMFFITDINGSEQTYNKTTIPACADCNNNVLASIESYIISIFKGVDLLKTFFSNKDLHNIIRWLEIIEYKFQILEIRRKFTKSKYADYIPYLADVPISIMRENINYSPSKAIAQIRIAQKRITVKSKKEKENSLVIFKTKNESFHFFHHLNDFIFLELPEFKIALFYFYSKTFVNTKDAHEAAMKIIKSVYEG
ncbi:MAG: hypothetical protein K0M50_00880 [Prolixibacteraceae bacterium]|nr:hypothetical protein [Prolixibacteraceae bacterium]